MLLNYWSTPMTTMCVFSRSDCNNPLIRTHCYSNKSILNIAFRTLINGFDLAHYYAWDPPPSI